MPYLKQKTHTGPVEKRHTIWDLCPETIIGAHTSLGERNASQINIFLTVSFMIPNTLKKKMLKRSRITSYPMTR